MNADILKMRTKDELLVGFLANDDIFLISEGLLYLCNSWGVPAVYTMVPNDVHEIRYLDTIRALARHIEEEKREHKNKEKGD